MPFPLLAVVAGGALVGLAGYVGWHAFKHFVRGEPWDLSWKGALSSVAAGAVALPAILFGSGIMAAAAGVELTPIAVGGATSIVGGVVGAIEDPGKQQQQRPPVVKPPQVNPDFDPFEEPGTAPVTTADTPAPVTTNDATSPVPSTSTPEEPATVTPTEPVAANPPTYKVEKGDTLTAIAREQGISLSDLEAANPQLAERKLPRGYTSPWDYIRTGEKIFLPSKSQGVTRSLEKIGSPAPVDDR